MSPLFLCVASALFLLAPWLLMPRRSPRPEIHGLLSVLDIVNRLYCALWHRLRSERPAPLPDRGPAMLIANHTCGIDHMLLQAGSRRVLGFLIAREFYDFGPIHPICRLIGCIPVRRDGKDLAATRAALRALEEGRVVPMFPEGRITPTSGRELGAGKPGVAFLALHARVPVIPAYISGTPETNNVWKALITPSRARVVYGPPIDLSDMPAQPPYDKATLTTVTERMMDAIRALRARVVAEAAVERGEAVRPAG
jgi:1-acyl-sn-glycerol-3-phosphate acyltransferase